MTFWEHLDELRSVLLKSLAAWLIASIAAFCFKQPLFELIFRPLEPGQQLLNIDVTAQFFTHVQVALCVGFVIALPLIVAWLYGFVAPALYQNEKRYSLIFVLSALLLFAAGVALNYFVIFPLSFNMLSTYQVSDIVVNRISLTSYISLLLVLSVFMGLMFEIPILTWLLAKLGILRREHLKRYRRHVFVAILIVAAVITPTGDPFTLMIVTLPIYLLYELSIIIIPQNMKIGHLGIVLAMVALSASISVQANDEIWVSADRPGAGTGSEVLDRGYIQWETGFECLHTLGMHLLAMPTTLFRFGLHQRVELRLEYTGEWTIFDSPDYAPYTQDDPPYTPAPLGIGTKILLCDHHGGSLDQAWIPRTAVLCNIGLPLSRSVAKDLPVSGSVDLLFENEVTEWLSLGYDVGVQWNEWAPVPDIFASLGVNFEPTEHLGLFVESFNIFDPDAIDVNTGKTYTHCHINMNFGITYAVHPRVQLDAYAGFNIYNSQPIFSHPQNYAFFGLGVTWLIWHPKT